ncbi:MAG TPA: hypothetical protein VHT04_00670 [Stellaceae bacterium]|jgi:hypothetical protein|nr:hypothetical protein [Stellaceae bacterium]
MSPSQLRHPAFTLLLLLSACSFANDTLWPSLSGEDPRGPTPAAAATAPQPAAGGVTSASTLAAGVPAASPVVGGKMGELRAQLQRLEGEVAEQTRQLDDIRRRLDEAANNLDTRAEGIETKLKSRTTPNDPQLLTDWNDAQNQINRTSEDMARLTNVSTWSTSDAALVSYILQSVRAAGGQPGVSEQEHRQLALLERDANRVSVNVDRLVSQVSGEIASRNLFVAAAHRRLAALGPAITLGRTASPTARPAVTAGSGPALVTIRFDRPDVAYEEQLFGAVNEALERRPDVAFDVVAVSPPGAAASSAAAAKRNIESVVQSLTSMGLPPDRLRLSARTFADASGNEVRIYPR